jgi:hypothetical protein
MPKRTNHKPPRRCIFCGHGRGRGEKMSDEHLWPEWMHPYLPKLDDPKKHEGFEVVRSGRIVFSDRKKPQQGHTYTKKLKIVCKVCNETWMSRIEDEAKPILIPLLQGQKLLLRRRDREVLATWLALKMMIFECEDIRDTVIDQASRIEFMKNQKIPLRIRIWIGYHNTFDWYYSYLHQTALATSSPREPAQSGFKNIQTTAFGFGHVFTLSLVTGRTEDFRINFNFPKSIGGINRLWPLGQSDINWPGGALSDAEVSRISQILREFLASRLTEWRPLGTPVAR